MAALAIGSARAQSLPAPDPASMTESAAATPSSATLPDCVQLCAGQPVEIELLEAVSSERHRNGDRFRIALAEPLMFDGTVIVPAGTTGIGEVIHASSSRAGGKPGELLLAARHLELADGTLPLRAMKLSARGKDKAAAALATSFVAGPFAMFVHGREIEIPPGTRAHAKLARDIDPARIATPPAEPHAQDMAAPPTPSPHPTTQDTAVSDPKE